MTVRMSEDQYQRLQSDRSDHAVEPELGEEVMPAHKRLEEAIAIDPGKTAGVAWTNSDQIEAWNSDFWAIHDTLQGHADRIDLHEEMVVLLEAPYLSRPGMRTGNTAQAYNSGGVARSAELLKNRLETIGYEVVEHDPSAQGPKWDAKTLGKMITWDGPNNEHIRDALRLLILYNFI